MHLTLHDGIFQSQLNNELLSQLRDIMASHPVILPSITFKSKSDAKTFFSNMLNCYKDGDDLSAADDLLLFELLQQHPEADDKIGVGISKFYRDRSNSHPTSCFHLKRHNASCTDFSVPSCISAKQRTSQQDFYVACRFAVTPVLTKQKAELFKNGQVKCFKTGELVDIKTSELRHTEPKFRDIIANFISKHQIELTKGLIVDNEDMQYATKFSSDKLTTSFVKYHSEVAKLEVFKKGQR